MQPEPERLGQKDVYELDRKAWNLPRPRRQLAIAPLPKGPPDRRSGLESLTNRPAERGT